MTDNRQLDPIEQRLADLDAARRAGLFGRTSVGDAAFRAAVGRSAAQSSGFFGNKWGAVAAAIIVVAGVWTWIATVEINAVRQGVRGVGATALASKSNCRDHGILNCVAGPTHLAMVECSAHDYDDDGDVDLADYSAFQRRCQGVSQ
jgi:hypothetical protein